RVLDPFADKVVVCGTFIYLAAAPGSAIAPWMAVVVTSRELLVTALRSSVEQAGGDFSARWVGKWKMALQCAAVITSLLLLASNTASDATSDATRDGGSNLLWWAAHAAAWLAVALTVYSGWVYARLAARMATEK
ncbi:MAG: CDP-alcohol phosphatidyltransferase family protein, partial [Planctomycetota bacterium]